jgi:tetratricopeptide (TPR) repeat protein
MIPGNRLRILACGWILTCALLCAAGEPAWIEVRSSNFTVISDDSAEQARCMAKRLEQFRSVFQSAFPRLRTDMGYPLIVFATRNKKSLKALISNDRMEKEGEIPAGMFMAGPERKFIVLRMDIPRNQGYHVVYHEYVHTLMNLNFHNLPLWLSEGLAELFAFTTVSDGDSKLGQASPEFLQVLKASSLIPLNTLMSVTQDSPFYLQREKVNVFYAESWALVHYLMFGENQIHLPQLNEFLNGIENGASDLEAAESAFGDLETLQENLEKYIRMDSFYQYSIKTKISVREELFTERQLTRAESMALRGELLIYADRLEEARAMLEQALEGNPCSVVANHAMGSLYLSLRDKGQAQKYFSVAADLDSQSYLAQFFAAQMAYERDGDYVAAEKYLRKTIDINPRFAPAFRMLSQTLMMKRDRETASEALELALKASRLEPSDLNHNINVGKILMAMDRYVDAYSLGHRILAGARTEADREKAESFLSMVNRYWKIEKRHSTAGKSEEQPQPEK